MKYKCDKCNKYKYPAMVADLDDLCKCSGIKKFTGLELSDVGDSTLMIYPVNKNNHIYHEVRNLYNKKAYYINRNQAIQIIKHLKKEFDIIYDEIGDLNG